LNSFQGHFSFFLIESKPTNIIDDKKKAKSLDDNWVWLGNLDILYPPKTRVDPRLKAIHTTNHAPNPPTALLEGMRRMEENFM